MSVMLSVAVYELAAAGVNVTSIVQLPPAATEVPQVSAISVKSAGFVPPMATLEIVKAALPVLLSVTVWAALVMPAGSLANERLVAERLADGALLLPLPTVAVAVPVPARETDCELPVALSEMLRVAVRDPLAAGVKVTLIVHVAPAAMLDPQLLVCEKSLESVPEIPMFAMLRAALPVLFKVTV